MEFYHNISGNCDKSNIPKVQGFCSYIKSYFLGEQRCDSEAYCNDFKTDMDNLGKTKKISVPEYSRNWIALSFFI